MKKKKLLAGLVASLLMSYSSLSASYDGIKYDYIIVGNGTAGSVLARKLSDDHKTKVLVLEAGQNNTGNPEVLDADGANLVENLNDLLTNPTFAKNYPVPGFVPLQAFLYSEGTGWGGSSAHNFLEVIRGTPGIYNTWATISGNPQWEYNNLLPLMLALENYTPCMTTANAAQRGTGGPISMTQTTPVNTDPLGMLLAGSNAGDAGFVADINDPTEVTTTGHYNLGFSAYQEFATTGGSPCTIGQRSFSAQEFLPPSIVSPEGRSKHGRLLRIESYAIVSRVLFEGKKAVGVEFVFGDNPNKVLKAYAKQIILCAGGVNSPAILQRSGIGDPAILEPLGIKTIVNNPNVGANLICQYGVNAIATGTTHAGGLGLQGFWSATGVTTPGFSYPNDNTRREQIVALQAGPGIVKIIGFNVQPLSRGNIFIVSRNPFVEPKLYLNMYTDGPVTEVGTDANLAVATYYLINQAITGGGGTMIFPSPAQFAGGTEALLAAAEDSDGVTIASHICGTARMGTSIANGVVDGKLRVMGVENLMVADLSVAPISPDGNTCYCVYMIGLNAARILGVPTPPAL